MCRRARERGAGLCGPGRSLLLALTLATLPAWSACRAAPSPVAEGTAVPGAGRHGAGSDASQPRPTEARPAPGATTPPIVSPSSTPFDPSPTASPPPRRPPATPSSGYHLDSPRGRIYASNEGSLQIFATVDGQLLASEPLLPDEVLLGVDAAGERLYVWSWRSAVLRVLAAEDRREVDRMPLEGMRPRLYHPEVQTALIDPAGQGKDWPGARPLLVRSTGELLTIEDRQLRAVVADGGRARQTWSINLGERVKGLWGMYLGDDGRHLYLQVSEASLGDFDKAKLGELIVLALPSGREVGRLSGGVDIVAWGAGDGVFATVRTNRWPIEHLVRLKAGQVLRRLSMRHGAYPAVIDLNRRHLIQSVETGMAVWDADTLELSHVSPWPWRQAPLLHDPVTDQFFLPTEGNQGLRAVQAEAQEAVVGEATPAALAHKAPTLLGFPLEVDGQVDPSWRIGHRPSARPTAIPNHPNFSFQDADAVSRDGGQTWTREVPAGLGRWPAQLLASAGFARDRTLYAHLENLGVWRSEDAGRSWRSANKGLEAMSLRALHLAPQTSGDLFAEEAYGDIVTDRQTGLWRSSDGGRSWRRMASYHALSFSPDYARSRRVLAFDGPQALVSQDGGRRWERRGRIPEVRGGTGWVGSSFTVSDSTAGPPLMLALVTSYTLGGSGFGFRWPDLGHRLLVSKDDGWHWEVAWLPDEKQLLRDQVYGAGGRLVGPEPLADAKGRLLNRWYLVVARRLTLTFIVDPSETASTDRPFYLWPVTPCGRPHAVPVAMSKAGGLLCFDEGRHAAFEVEADAFERGSR